MNRTKDKETEFATVQVKVDEYRVKCMLCSAFEGGSNYWLGPVKYKYGEGYKKEDFREGGRLNDRENYWHPLQLVPMTEGCSLVIKTDDDDKEYTLDRAALVKGLQLMAEKHPKHFRDMMDDNDDATTGDVFLQLALFGEVVYG